MPNYAEIAEVGAGLFKLSHTLFEGSESTPTAEALGASSARFFGEAKTATLEIVGALSKTRTETLSRDMRYIPNTFIDGPGMYDPLSVQASYVDSTLETPAYAASHGSYTKLFRPFLRRDQPVALDETWRSSSSNFDTRTAVAGQLSELLKSGESMPEDWHGVLKSFDWLYKNPPGHNGDWVSFKEPVLSKLNGMIGPHTAFRAVDKLVTRRFTIPSPFDGTTDAVSITRFSDKVMQGATVRAAESAVKRPWRPSFKSPIEDLGDVLPVTSETHSTRVLDATRQGWEKRIADVERRTSNAIAVRKLLEERVPALNDAGPAEYDYYSSLRK